MLKHLQISLPAGVWVARSEGGFAVVGSLGIGQTGREQTFVTKIVTLCQGPEVNILLHLVPSK